MTPGLATAGKPHAGSGTPGARKSNQDGSGGGGGAAAAAVGSSTVSASGTVVTPRGGAPSQRSGTTGTNKRRVRQTLSWHAGAGAGAGGSGRGSPQQQGGGSSKRGTPRTRGAGAVTFIGAAGTTPERPAMVSLSSPRMPGKPGVAADIPTVGPAIITVEPRMVKRHRARPTRPSAQSSPRRDAGVSGGRHKSRRRHHHRRHHRRPGAGGATATATVTAASGSGGGGSGGGGGTEVPGGGGVVDAGGAVASPRTMAVMRSEVFSVANSDAWAAGARTRTRARGRVTTITTQSLEYVFWLCVCGC